MSEPPYPNPPRIAPPSERPRARQQVRAPLSERATHGLLAVLAGASALVLAFVALFIAREALPLFAHTSLADFLTGNVWMPIDYTGSTSFGILNFIAATVAVSALSLAMAAFVSIGCAVFLAFGAPSTLRTAAFAAIDLLAGVPSVIYGFVGLTVVVPAFLRAGVSTGSCVLAASLVLALMVVPYLVSTCAESLVRMKAAYLEPAIALGMGRWHAAATVALPAARGSILTALLLAFGRALGETMAVMMVVGNANLFPTLLGKAETIPALIALEMGTAQAGSPHYHALYAAALVLLALLLAINLAGNALRRKLRAREEGR
ncbi:phosphate ABC transporter permease subunit PstC [Eggerthellaceae bacterium zg-1084]|uniref:phosphate ABC transporter permease subunit PstC n=1 Tax=Berryella wangjianweii TaxID=2734634 RepID=UPI0015550BB1|nr:phosphate ABC transporter permease subunit PstC [Berryella wangjianweii]NPD30597.1 phosphate ABC transporter permease subunit PstC [Berryella wangjianweii]